MCKKKKIESYTFQFEYFQTNINDARMLTLIGFAKQRLNNEKFLNAVSQLDNSDLFILRIADLKDAPLANVHFYKSIYPFSSVNAYTKGNNIYLNTRKLFRGDKEIVATLIHEYSHVLGYKHSKRGVLDDFPYQLDQLVLDTYDLF